MMKQGIKLGFINRKTGVLISDTQYRNNFFGTTSKLKLFDVPVGKKLIALDVGYVIYNGAAVAMNSEVKIYCDNTVVYSQHNNLGSSAGYAKYNQVVDVSHLDVKTVYWTGMLQDSHIHKSLIITVTGLIE